MATALTSNWLHVDIGEETPLLLSTLSSCMTLSDVQCDGYVRLLAADISLEDDDEPSAKLKVFRGLKLKQEQSLPGIPTAIESLYIDETEPKTPVIAVAIAESVLFYRHMKPYFKYTVPALDAEELELEVWRKLPVMKTETHDELLQLLKEVDHAKLSRKTQRLLQLSGEERESFIETHKDSPVGRVGNIVAMCCLKRVSSSPNPPSHLVLATDTGRVFVLEPQGFNLVYQARTCSYETAVPSLISVHGTYETDFCIVVGTRNGGVYLLRKANNEGQEILKMTTALTGLLLLPVDQTIVVTTMEQRYLCYSKRGKLLYQVQLEAQPVCILPLMLAHLGLTLVAVALQGGVVKFFLQRYLVDEFVLPETVAAMLYGRMGMEDHVLTLTTQSGEMFFKILRRVTRFETDVVAAAAAANKSATKSQRIADVSILDKPKKSSIFVEQAAREKLKAKASYGSFQVELWRLRHTAARATIDAINSSESTISGDLTHAPVKLSAEVCGSGPAFRLYLTVQNLSTFKMASNLVVLLHADRRHYTMSQSMARLPSVLPGIPLRVDFEVVAVLDPMDKLPPGSLTPDNSQIRVMLLKTGQSKPLIAAAVAMPQSEAAF
ncbi:Bardet-Biedl syndrome 1 protein homolog [Drosophila sulfurigaster albostrigata]|uniref:Bardet-Biedl syndrome 1 protein homolog n=1 Tax=Drosophila sulfurigaster albostrigata TaxID=89887 RepID=UPI002D21B085|nr:Bardet-Biedl syndrome 1 protein homolog [Drosophila sulfurigaster albostrigata]